MAGARLVVGKQWVEMTSLHAGFKRQKGSLSPTVAVTNYMRGCMHAQSCPTLCDPMDHNLPGSSVHGISQREYWSGLVFPTSGDLPDSGIKSTSPAASAALAGEFFTAKPLGKLTNYISYSNSPNVSVQLPFLSSCCKMRIEIPDLAS